jgi:predicted RNA-binding Zn-ribbon protein involved in translation (DUF1610 family)
MTWEEHLKANPFIMEILLNNSHREPTDIECPKCGKQIYVRTDIVLASNPPQRLYECDCGWTGYSY